MARPREQQSEAAASERERAKRRRGGQELPDDVQDRPEQNAGYDEAVHDGPPGTPEDPLLELDSDLRTETAEELEGDSSAPADDDRDAHLRDIDDRAEQGAAAEVRRRERSGR